MADEQNKMLEETLKDKLASKRFALPALGMVLIYMLAELLKNPMVACILIAIIALGGLGAEFYLKLRGMWNGAKNDTK